MDVDWAQSQVPSAELRVGERVPGFSARLTRAQSARMELVDSDQGNSDAVEPDSAGTVEPDSPDAFELDTDSESEGLCAGEACVRARSELREPAVVRVDLDVDALSVALAHALATALDGRVLAAPANAPVGHAPAVPTTPKRSFWAGAWHADVVLSSIAILIVVVVLLAWTV